MGIIGSIIIGCLAGFCAGKLMKGGGMGFHHQEVNTTCKEGLRSSLLSNLLSKRALDCAPKPFVYVDDCVKLVCSFEFFEETGVVFGEHAEVADAILQVGDALDTHTEGVA